MPDMRNLRECDLSTIDIRTLSPEEWDAVKREVVRRAHAERAKVVRDTIARLKSWWRDGRQSRYAAAEAGGSARFPSVGRA